MTMRERGLWVGVTECACGLSLASAIGTVALVIPLVVGARTDRPRGRGLRTFMGVYSTIVAPLSWHWLEARGTQRASSALDFDSILIVIAFKEI